MDLGNFTNPLETVQIISIFNYLNLLNDILFAENYLKRTDQHKQIPIVNALYHYLMDRTDNQFDIDERKIHLARRLINGSDLFGAKETEKLELHFVNTMLNHIIKSLVFGKFGNIYGFIAEAVRASSNDSLVALTNHLKQSLQTMTFENESGENSALDALAIDTIFQNFIKPLFPLGEGDVSILSVDFIYGQAGRTFLSGPSTQMEYTNKNTNLTLEDEAEVWQQYTQLAHAIEQLVIAGQVNKTALKIFALPALVYYVYTQKADLQSMDIADVINGPEHWAKAFESLFSYLNQTFLAANQLEDNYRYQFYLALSNYRNRTTLAREIIENNCSPLTDREMAQEITRYKNRPKNYKCKDGKHLEDLNENFRYLISNITQKYYTYEVESCREAFGDDFISSVDKAKVIITQGLFHRYFYVMIGFNASQVQLIKPSDDFFEFYYPDNGTYLYFALIRTGYHVKLIQVTEKPDLLRRKLFGRLGRLRNNIFSSLMKREDENFSVFLAKLAEKRTKNFSATLTSSGLDKTRKEWWKEFGLSLVPFYTCVNSIKEGRKISASISCSIDAVLLIPVVGTAANVGGKLASSVSKSLINLSQTTFTTLALRTSMQSTLKVTGNLLTKQVAEFIALFELKTFQNLGTSALRFVDPGFELVFLVGKGGLRSIESFITIIEKRTSASFESVKIMLKTSENAVTYVPKQIGILSGKEVFVNSLIGSEGSFGYKYVRLASGQIAELRTIPELNQQLPVVFRIKDNSKMYRRISLETGEVFGEEFSINDQWMELSKPESRQLRSEIDVVDGNIIKTVQTLRSNRELIKIATEYAAKKQKLPETEVLKELKKYAFPSEPGKTEINFVQEWMNHNDLKVPSWAEKFRIVKPDLFFQLKYKEMMDTPDLTIHQARKKIQTLYPDSNYHHLLQELPIDQILKDFKEKKAYHLVKFEDYFALRNYGANGYKKMGDNCHQARRIKNAIYRLAIRQSEEPGEIYAKRLFRGERRIPEAIEKELSDVNGEFEFTRFTSTSTDIDTAIKYSQLGASTQTQVFYDMKFEKPIVRARVEDLFVLEEKETILLPGTKFHVDHVKKWTEVTESGVKQNFIKVEMTCVEETLPKVERQKSLMEEINKLMKTDTVFYADDLSN